jgi:hypothetical protein
MNMPYKHMWLWGGVVRAAIYMRGETSLGLNRTSMQRAYVHSKKSCDLWLPGEGFSGLKIFFAISHLILEFLEIIITVGSANKNQQW